MNKFPTYIELDACIDTIERLAKDCTLLLEQSALVTALPTIQYDWMAPFRVAWIKDKTLHEVEPLRHHQATGL